VFGWTLFASLFIIFPASAFFFLRSPFDAVGESILRQIIFTGFFLLFFDLVLFLALFIHQALFKREKFSEDLISFVIE
jgi:hypothetical protein